MPSGTPAGRVPGQHTSGGRAVAWLAAPGAPRVGRRRHPARDAARLGPVGPRQPGREREDGPDLQSGARRPAVSRPRPVHPGLGDDPAPAGPAGHAGDHQARAGAGRAAGRRLDLLRRPVPARRAVARRAVPGGRPPPRAARGPAAAQRDPRAGARPRRAAAGAGPGGSPTDRAEGPGRAARPAAGEPDCPARRRPEARGGGGRRGGGGEGGRRGEGGGGGAGEVACYSQPLSWATRAASTRVRAPVLPIAEER